jgi:hypothetical protein
MSATIYASIKARMAGVVLINTGLLNASFSHRVNISDIFAEGGLPSSTGGVSQFDGKSIFHKKVELIYRHVPRSVRVVVDAICMDLVCDLLKTQLRSLHEINSQPKKTDSIQTLEADCTLSPFLNPEHHKAIESATTFSELKSIVGMIFYSPEFHFTDDGDCREHEEQIDRLYYRKLFFTLSKSPCLCRRHLKHLYGIKFARSRSVVDQRTDYHQIDSITPSIPPAGLFAKKQSKRDENRYLIILTKALRRSPITPLPIFAYILMLEVWCDRVAGLLSRAQVEPRMTEL